ncbi:methyltransferase domain-containing protein [Streptomyces radiopugnans]|nr:methyltransferase domain-containing protein [Streptomyces radiopugnans]
MDWRADYDALSYEPVSVPEPVAESVRRFMDHYHLNYGAFDFAVTPAKPLGVLRVQPRRAVAVHRRRHQVTDRRGPRRPSARSRRMTAPADPARDLRTALAHRLTTPGDPWRAAFETVPRHVFVPSIHEQAEDGRWATITPENPHYWEAVYSDRALTTQLADGTPTSSSSQPSLMLEMLHALDVADGHRVLEVGTGTGYNAALLSHRLGDSRVTTMDVDPDLTGAAARRLGEAGHHPAVRVGDGAHGVPDRAPYDRIIATCGLPSVPWPWIEQAGEGTVIVVPIGWGVARLTVHDDAAEGAFLPGGAYFMPRRTGAVAPDFA